MFTEFNVLWPNIPEELIKTSFISKMDIKGDRGSGSRGLKLMKLMGCIIE